MEPPSKRRRLQHREGLRKAHRSYADLQEAEIGVTLLNQAKSYGDQASLLRGDLQGASDYLKQPVSLGDNPQKVYPRQLVPNAVPQAAQPAITTVESVIRVIIDNPAGTAIGDVLVPAQSSVFAFDGYGSVTLPSTASPTSPPPPPARFESLAPSSTLGPQSQAPQPTQQPTPMPTDQSSSRPSEAPTMNISGSTNSPASSSPMTINVPDSSSQVVLSSPPATPIPSSPSSPGVSISASGIGSTSYFSLSSSIPSATTSSQTSITPNPNQIPTNVPAPTSGNFSMTCKFLDFE